MPPRSRVLAMLAALVACACCLTACSASASAPSVPERLHATAAASRHALLVAIPLPGHVNPLLSQAFELRRRGWTVTVASPSRMASHIAAAFAAARARNDSGAAGVEYLSLGECGDKAELHDALQRAADHENFMESSREMFHWALSLHSCMFSQLLAGVEKMEIRPTVIVADFATYAGLDAADRIGVPCVVNNPDLLNMLSPDDVASFDFVPGTTTASSISEVNDASSGYGIVARVAYPPLRVILRWIIESTAGVELAASQRSLGIPPSARGLLSRFSGRLILVNNVFGLEYARPLAPNVVLVGPMLDQKWVGSISRAREGYRGQLSAEDRAWLDLFPGTPVLWVSMGTIAPLNQRQVTEMAAAFSALASSGVLRILWKLDREDHVFLPPASGMPPSDKLKVVTWVSSQLGVLAHDATRVFLSHCGINSVHESVYLGTPLLCIPILADQADMAARVEDAGCGRHLSKSTFTAATLTDSLLHLLDNALSTRSALYRARDSMLLSGGVERAVDYIEYVSEHGTDALVPVDVGHPWWVRANLDAFLIHALLALLCYKLCYFCCCTVRPGKECIQDRKKIKAGEQAQAAGQRRKAE